MFFTPFIAYVVLFRVMKKRGTDIENVHRSFMVAAPVFTIFIFSIVGFAIHTHKVYFLLLHLCYFIIPYAICSQYFKLPKKDSITYGGVVFGVDFILLSIILGLVWGSGGTILPDHG